MSKTPTAANIISAGSRVRPSIAYVAVRGQHSTRTEQLESACEIAYSIRCLRQPRLSQLFHWFTATRLLLTVTESPHIKSRASLRLVSASRRSPVS